MPVTPTKAKLWFDTKEQEQEYDDKMIANIELKSLDFDDENFSPVFNRATQEVFLEPNERYLSDFHKMFTPVNSISYESAINKWGINPIKADYNRGWTISKFLSGFGITYLVMRELPLRNFYARGFLMILLFSKFTDHVATFFPWRSNILAAWDPYHHQDLRCYDTLARSQFIVVPHADNQLDAGERWRQQQPGHMRFLPHHFLGHIGKRFQEVKHVEWDGTMNMPLHRLADPGHKESFMMVAH
mmetsp:Transcript_8356/g.7424  ORF Transcript_8356/g.7424 Transcript_8356/m.7424 type:complete len:244 (+) Transcript_8356:44-775(+)|eukprot:CAMPEP_0114586076 /NCGR_PEP_ID=MMETSP0125-20121206/9411_1 /TAXON_ID=485358 ORGANISM="Aristerostoma sp., Strain ATCC 50986" /NCGR_SAMPLE_ID=MMETSP0125 /ASSEMBLY_ACC=CAM_ASM_000245 /LENGTH=243 /DNA_ID=CAMNT_0001781375 /DNA_START=31 /DNA_END=762 /DNA_ORIENTATION=+